MQKIKYNFHKCLFFTNLITQFFPTVKPFRDINIDDTEFACLKAIVFFDPSKFEWQLFPKSYYKLVYSYMEKEI